jgi:hypothetical protein
LPDKLVFQISRSQEGVMIQVGDWVQALGEVWDDDLGVQAAHSGAVGHVLGVHEYEGVGTVYNVLFERTGRVCGVMAEEIKRLGGADTGRALKAAPSRLA